MPTTFYFRDGGAGFAGFKIARLTRGASTTTATVNTTGGGTDIQWTNTAGGTLLSFCTRPLSAAVTISGSVSVNVYASESAIQANAGFRLKLYRLKPNGTETLFATLDRGAELPTTTGLQSYSGTPTSTVFVVGDRIVMEPYITNIGTMGANRTCDLLYNGTSASNTDSRVTFDETILVAAKTLAI